MKDFKCQICGNENPLYLGVRNNQKYCRRCVTFNGRLALRKNHLEKEVIINLPFSLSKEQLEISSAIEKAYLEHKNVLLCAVCGSGKTELVFKTIARVISEGKQVGFVIPRRDVVIDLYPRIQEAFKGQRVVAVYGGHNEDLEGDIIVLTSHQLYRYKDYFDYLIMDETDAFPYYDNEVLKVMFYRSLKGNYVMMSATALPSMIETIKKENGIILHLNKRYHGHPLPVPKFKSFLFGKKIALLYYLRKFIKKNLPVLVFVPTIFDCQYLYRTCSFFFKKGSYVHSKKKDRLEVVEKFKSRKLDYLISTSVLERGVTIKNLQVIIYDASNTLFDEKALVQISGRVGRKLDAYDGEVIFICDYVSKSMEEAKRKIESANSS